MTPPSELREVEVEEGASFALLDQACDLLEDVRTAIAIEHPLTKGEVRTILLAEKEQRTKAQILESVIKSHAEYLWHDIGVLFDNHPDIVYSKRVG